MVKAMVLSSVFDQPSFAAYAKMESLLVKALIQLAGQLLIATVY